MFIADCQLPIADCGFEGIVAIAKMGNLQLAIGNRQCFPFPT
jgi:hypothetical protein